ncbi:hypothetical protein GBAR_LOCUS9143, partial [Geodia barretti]
ETPASRSRTIRTKLPLAEQQQHVERVVHVLVAPPVVAVVPAADLLAVESGQLRGEHRVQVGVGVPADIRVAPVQGQIGEVVEVGEQAHLGEFAHSGEERELDVGVGVLDRRVQPAQVVAVLASAVSG